MAALRRGEGEGRRRAAEAAEGADEGAAEGEAEGAAAREVSRLIGQLLERVSAEQRQRGAQGPLLRMVCPSPPAARHLPPATPSPPPLLLPNLASLSRCTVFTFSAMHICTPYQS